MNTKKSLTRIFGPALLLTATMALPVDTALAAKEPGRAAHADKHDKDDKSKKGKKQVARPQPQRRQQVVVRQNRIDRQNEQRQAEIRRQQALHQQNIQRQQALRRQQIAQAQDLERRRALDRQQALQRQRQNQQYRYDDRYRATPRRGGGGADPGVFHVDGVLDDGGECLFLRDHEGRTWAMVGNVYGLQAGEHVRLYGRPVDGAGTCGYRAAAFDIYEVRTVWADNGHRRTFYDHLYDGPFDQNRAYDDDRYYSGQYDPYEDRQDRDNWWDRLFGG